MSEYSNKIFFKLNKSNLYDSKYDESVNNLIKYVNLGVMPVHSDTLPNSVLSWSGFCDMVLALIKDNKPIDFENLKAIYVPKQSSSVSRALNDVVDPELLVEEPIEEKTKRLLQIADVSDILDIMDPELMSEEGWRAQNLIGNKVTSLDGYEINPDVPMPVVRLNPGEDIVSPYSNSTNVYRIDEAHYLDIETDEIFKVFWNSDKR